jgi:hypothetical protein
MTLNPALRDGLEHFRQESRISAVFTIAHGLALVHQSSCPDARHYVA